MTSTPPRQRLPLHGTNRRRLPFERRLRLWLLALALPTLILAGVLIQQHTDTAAITALCVLALALGYALTLAILFDQLTRPLQTLSNVVAALREEDFSFRARGARRGDSLGDLALEINALAGTLQTQRSAALDALTLAELVMTAMPSPVLAFDAEGQLRLLNPAAAGAFALHRTLALGKPAHELGLSLLMRAGDQTVFTPDLESSARPPTPAAIRWSVRRTTFRLHGIPHSLFVLTDVAAALREEERTAWQRLIRVLGHEINNSLTPIKSIAGSLRAQLPGTLGEAVPEAGQINFGRGLAVIEDRAESLNRFLQAYQRLSRLPPPALGDTPLAPLVRRVVALETRLPVHIDASPDTAVLADPDQLEQLLINLLRNAVDAALTPDLPPPREPAQVVFSWFTAAGTAILQITDNGPGLLNPLNLFVPFYTTKPNGGGVGLLLARQIASAHNGSVTLSNREDRTGCLAEVRLPLSG